MQDRLIREFKLIHEKLRNIAQKNVKFYSMTVRNLQ